jgi:serine/threonine protein kinase
MIGQTLNRYKITNLLGEGGMGAVYKGRDMTLQRDVAVKIMHPHFARQPNFQERFLQEARTAARLSHPGIVQVFDFGQQQGVLYIVMEFIQGDNLGKMLRDLRTKGGSIPLAESVHLIEQVSQALDYAHKLGVLHRDIKPDNIMLKQETGQTAPFRPVLTDLGLAKLVEGGIMTQEGTSMGTPAYMSPEQALGQPTDPRSDVYSLGILLFELAVGRLPFPARTITEAIQYHTKQAPPAPHTIRPDIPEPLERIILKAIEKDPSRRFSSAMELAQALSQLKLSLNNLAPSTIAAGNMLSLTTQFQESLVGARGASIMLEFGDPGDLSQDKILVLTPDKTSRSIPIKPGGMKLGRETDNDIVVDDKKASRHHARVEFKSGQYVVIDLDSTNGTYMGNTRMLPGVAQEWTPDKPIRIGDVWIRLVRAANKGGTTVAQQAGTRADGTAIDPNMVRSSAGSGRVGVFLESPNLSAEPGKPQTFSIVLLNQGAVVDHFKIIIEGIPQDWVTIPAAVQLLPGDQQTVSLGLQPPRSPQFRAGRYAISLRVTSQSDPSQFAEIKANLTLKHYSQFTSELFPERFKTGAPSQVKINNLGNVPESFQVLLKDRADELEFSPSQGQVNIPEGKSGVLDFSAKPRQRRLIGGEKTHAISAQVKNALGDIQNHTGEVISYGVIPPWVLPVLMTLCLLLFIGSGIAFAAFTTITGTQTAVANQTAMAIAGRVTEQLSTLRAGTSQAETQIALLSVTPTPSITPSITPSETITPTFTATSTGSVTPSFTPSPTKTPTDTLTPTPSITPTPPLGTRMEDFIGTWVNVDDNTGGVTRVVVKKANNTTLSIKAYGKCSPSDCDWSAMVGSDPQTPFTPNKVIFYYVFSFKTTRVTLERASDKMLVETYDTFSDGSTPPVTANYVMKWQPIFIIIPKLTLIVPIFPTAVSP